MACHCTFGSVGHSSLQLPVKATPAGRLVVDLLEAKMIQDGCFGDRKWDNVGQADCDYESAL